jgi:hypothetical protein
LLKKSLNQSLVLLPNFSRYLATRIAYNFQDQNLLIKTGNLLFLSESRFRVLLRIIVSAGVGLLGGLASTLPYGILLLLATYDLSDSCIYRCDKYFEHLPKNDVPVKVYTEKVESRGQLIITNSEEPVEIYIPDVSKPLIKKTEASVETCKTDSQVRTNKKYKKLKKPAKMVKFSEFRKTDPVLSKFNDQNLEEPYIPQQNCKISEAIREDLD